MPLVKHVDDLFDDGRHALDLDYFYRYGQGVAAMLL